MATYTEDPLDYEEEDWERDLALIQKWEEICDRWDWDTTNPPIDILEGEEDYE